MDNKKKIDIRVFGSKAIYADTDLKDEPRVVEIIRAHVLPQTAAEYRFAVG
jgi:hypothetical protein